nr:flagellin [Aeromonas veronii]
MDAAKDAWEKETDAAQKATKLGTYNTAKGEYETEAGKVTTAQTNLDTAQKNFDKATVGAMTAGSGLDSKTLEYGLKSQEHAQKAIGELESFMQDITSVRSAFGANINRLEHTVNNLSNMKENTDIAKGRIMDADFATESTNMTKNQMLMQAGMSVLGQANQMTGMVTGLLR